MEPIAQSRLQVATLWMLLIYGIGFLLVTAKTLLVPLVLAVFLWYLVNMLAGLFGRIVLSGRHPPHWLRYLLSGATLAATVTVVVRIISDSIGEVINTAPVYQQNLQALLETLRSRIHFIEIPATSQLVGSLNIGTVIRNVATSFGSLVGNMGLIAVYMMFLFLEQRHFGDKLVAVSPDSTRQDRIRGLLSQIDHDIRTYVGIKTLMSAMTSIAAWVVMSLVGLDFAAFWALLIFVLNYIPNIGSLLATSLPSLLALVQFDTLTPFVLVLAGVGTIQMLVGNVLEPNLMGKSLNVSPLIIILSLVVWGFLWGVPGMFLCVPITVVVMIILYNFNSTRWIALLLSQDGRIKR